MNLRQSHLPYCIQKLDDGRHIVLNRRYKPLGSTTADWVDYATDPTAAKLAITSAIASQLSWNGSPDDTTIYLYNDGCIPTDSAAHMRAYLDRLAVMAKIKHKPA